jgi:hypothetical protein
VPITDIWTGAVITAYVQNVVVILGQRAKAALCDGRHDVRHRSFLALIS